MQKVTIFAVLFYRYKQHRKGNQSKLLDIINPLRFPLLKQRGFIFVLMIMAKKIELIYGSVIEQIKILTGGDKAKTAEAIGMFALYDYEGEEYDGDNILVKAAFAGMKPLNDLHEVRALAGAKGGARSHGGGAPKGNQNGAKIQQAKQQAKFGRGENTPLEIQQANNKQTTSKGCNSLNNSELQGEKFNKQNSTSKTSKPSMIREDKISLDNTSPLPELVLSKQEKELLEKETDETALAPLNGGAVSSYSFSDKQNSSDGKATPAPCNGRASLPTGLNEKNWNEGETTPQTSSANSHSVQTPPPPTPAPVCGGKYEPREGDDEITRNIRAQCKAEAEQIEAGFVAKERGGEPPKGMRRIRANDILHDDSKEAEIERERVRLPKLVKLAEEEADPAQKAQILEMAKGVKTKIANYESTKKETDGNERAGQVRV